MGLASTLRWGSRNKFGMTLRFVKFVFPFTTFTTFTTVLFCK